MRAGNLNQRVIIEEAITHNNDYGDLEKEWVARATVSANIRHQSGKEFSKDNIDLQQVKASIRIRKRDWVTSDMRIRERGNIWNIQAVLPDSTGTKHIDLACVKGLDDER